MSYSGNPALSSEIKTRILSTFDQTLDLAREGNRQEALLGCDFVIRMDPQFQPAHLLQERLRSSNGPVRVDDLQGAPAAAAPPMDDLFGDLDGLSLDLPPELPDDSTSYLRDEMQSLFDQRRFQDLLAVAEREQGTIALHPELRRIASAAQELMEAEPYILKFLNGARQALQTGQADEAARLLDKARALDPEHPGLLALDRSRGASPAPAPPRSAAPAAAPAPPIFQPSPAPALKIPVPLESGAVPTSLDFGGGDSESDRRIHELLAEGQAALDGGDPQGAIDSWSRIFLIDIDHQEASRRIESARKLKAESERQVEEIFHDGLARLEAGDPEAARQAFQRVLELQPSYFAAREYLQQLEAGNIPAPRPRTREMPVAEPVLSVPAERSAPQELKEEILVPPEPGEEPVAAAERRPSKRTAAARDSGRARRLFLMVGGAVLLLAIAGGWFVFQNWERFFPNSQAEVPTAPAPAAVDPIARAERLHATGKTAIALNQLRRIPQTDPQYPRAQKLIAEWSGAPAPGAPPTAVAGTQPETPVAADPVAERRQALLAAARQAIAEGSNLRALRRLEQAGTIAKLEGADAELLADVKRRLEPVAKQLEYFRQREWEHILRDLWIKHEAEPGNRDVTQLLVDCNYNLAVRDLQRNDATKALVWLTDATKLQPDDAVLRRHYLFAQTYQERPKDLLYKIYVKYLPFR
jgi:tetratricopeptide (TPR) repeat protein